MLTNRPDQIAAAVEGFFWPKIFWDFITKTLDPAVKPIPVLQSINLVFGIILLAWEWPLGFLAGSSLHRSLEARLAFLPLTALAAALMYQGTNAAIYQVIGLGVYFWAYSEGEVCWNPVCWCCGVDANSGTRWSARSPGLCRNGRRGTPRSKTTHVHIFGHNHRGVEKSAAADISRFSLPRPRHVISADESSSLSGYFHVNTGRSEFTPC